MKKPVVEQLFPLIGSKVTLRKIKWIEGPCPLAPWRHDDGIDRHPSFGIKSEDNKKSRVKCFSCGFHGDLMDLMIELGHKLRGSPDEIKKNYRMDLAVQLAASESEDQEFDPNIPDFGAKTEDDFLVIPEDWLESFKSILLFPNAIKYCQGRGISKTAMKEMDLRYDPLRQRVCFPYRDFSNRLCGVQGRYIGDPVVGRDDDGDHHGPPRYFFYQYLHRYNGYVWLGEHQLALDHPVVTVEGPFDYASVRRVYRNVCASFSAGIGSTKIKRLADAVEIVSMYDFGKGGDSARTALVKYLPRMPITHVVPPSAELDPGAMDEEMIRELLAPHVKLD